MTPPQTAPDATPETAQAEIDFRVNAGAGPHGLAAAETLVGAGV